MNVAYILAFQGEFEAERTAAAVIVLTQCGYDVVTLGRDIASDKLTDSLDTQYGTTNPRRAAYAYEVRLRLGQARRGDVIMLLDPWQTDIFRGVVERGYYKPGVPVVELWAKFETESRFVIFVSETHRVRASRYWHPDHITSLPHVIAVTDPTASIELHEVNPIKVDSLEFLYQMSRGVPVLAPDFGIWKEMIIHGSSGILYRSEKGRAVALKWALRLDSANVQIETGLKFGFETSVDTIGPYLKGIINA